MRDFLNILHSYTWINKGKKKYISCLAVQWQCMKAVSHLAFNLEEAGNFHEYKIISGFINAQNEFDIRITEITS